MIKTNWKEVELGDTVFIDNYQDGEFPQANPKVSGPYTVVTGNGCGRCLKTTKGRTMMHYPNNLLVIDKIWSICLIATDGDCAAGRLSMKNSVIPVDFKHQKIVCDFLRIQQDLLIEIVTNREKDGGPANDKHNEACAELTELGVFNHKFHYRTFWKLGLISELIDNAYGDDWDVEEEYQALFDKLKYKD